MPPYLGTYPRYIFGKLVSDGYSPSYLTIDDLRAVGRKEKRSLLTDIYTYNTTGKDAERILGKTDVLIVICGVHVPGKYLSAVPGSLSEVSRLIKDLRCKKILTGPAATGLGSQAEGGRAAQTDISAFDSIEPEMAQEYDEIARYAVPGASIVRQVPYEVIAELETARGCRKEVPCSFCTEPLKHRFERRDPDSITAEARALASEGVRHMRLGKQSDLFAWEDDELEKILAGISLLKLETFHIDNVDPCMVTEKKASMVVRHCTSGNVAALGVETFDKEVAKANNLNSSPAMSLSAIRLLNEVGRGYGENGMPRFLPGINIIMGLIGETRKTHEENMRHLSMIAEEGLLLRRINIRQVAVYPGTQIAASQHSRNKRSYWKWREEIRQKIDFPMLQKLVPKGHILRRVRMEVHDGNTTFGRQWGTYPLTVGIKKRLELKKSYDVRVTGHMLRSITAEVI